MAAVTPFQEAELLGRLALACGLAGVLGWERQMGRQPAGLRTHMLVSLGAAAFTVAGTFGVAGHGTIQDAGRVAAQIVVGIGFIGAGAIWRSTGNERVIRGLTTAASIWVAASIGMLCGYGLYVLAVGSATITLVVLRLLRGMERVTDTFWRRLTLRSREMRISSGHSQIDDAPEADTEELSSAHGPGLQETPMSHRQRKRRQGKRGKKKRKAQADVAD